MKNRFAWAIACLLLALTHSASVAAGPMRVRITLAAAGDLLMHMPIVQSVRDEQTGGYHFAEAFAPIAPYLASADYTIANLETCLAGPKKGYHGYPRFNTPADLASELRDLGVDMVTTGNNHCLDQGWEGLVATLANLDRAGLEHVGTYRTAGEAAEPLVVDVRGVRLAMLNFTNTTNGLPVPKGKEFSVNLVSPEAILRQAREARAAGADLVIALLHFGTEYQRNPNAEQRQLAEQLVRGGVDVIIGTHPHVVQPIETITVTRNGEPYQAVVAYSLGNLLSNQRERYRDSGIILYLEIEKDAHGTRVASTRYLPVWVYKGEARGRLVYRVLPVHPQIPGEADVQLSPKDQRRMEQVWGEITTHLGASDPSVGPIAGTRPLARGLSEEFR